MSRKAHILGLPFLALCLTLGLTAGTASAQRVQRAPSAATPKRPAASVATHAGKFRPKRVSNTLARKAHGKPVMTVGKLGAGRYAKHMKDTIEILFSPEASSYGHLYIRVGDRLYDFGGPGFIRDQSFGTAMTFVSSPMYGFVFDSTPEQVAELKRAYSDLVASRPEFHIAGTGCGGYSCAGFVTSVLQSRAPELQVGLSAAAIGAAGRLLRSGSFQGLTLYGRAIDKTGDEGFSFDKLD